MEKKDLIKGEAGPSSRNLYIFFGGGEGRTLTLDPPLRVTMSESDYKTCNIFVNYSSHNYIKIQVGYVLQYLPIISKNLPPCLNMGF